MRIMVDKQKYEAISAFADKHLKEKSPEHKEKKVCDENGESHLVSERDGLVERINKKFVTNDGRQLLQD